LKAQLCSSTSRRFNSLTPVLAPRAASRTSRSRQDHGLAA
jgi:hypothetical protein